MSRKILNIFEQLEESTITNDNSAMLGAIGKNVQNQLHSFRIVGNIFELYTSMFLFCTLDIINKLAQKRKYLITIKVDCDFSIFSEDNTLIIVDLIKDRLEIDKNIEVVSVLQGSVLITLEMDDEEAQRLFLAIKNGKLKGIGITDANLKRLEEIKFQSPKPFSLSASGSPTEPDDSMSRGPGDSIPNSAFFHKKDDNAKISKILNDTIQYVKLKIGENKTKVALEYLLDKINGEAPIYSEIIILQGLFFNTQKRELDGTYLLEEARREYIRIHKTLLYFLNIIKDDDLVQS